MVVLNCSKQEDDIAARMLKLRGRVPTTDELVAMVQEKKKAAVEEVKQKVCGTSIQLVPVDTDGTVLLVSMYSSQAPLHNKPKWAPYNKPKMLTSGVVRHLHE